MDEGGDYGGTSRPSLPAGQLANGQSEEAYQNQAPQMDKRPRTSNTFPNNYRHEPNEFNISHIERDTSLLLLRNSFPSPLLLKPNQTDNEVDSDTSPGIRNQSLPDLATQMKLNSSASRINEPITSSCQKRVR